MGIVTSLNYINVILSFITIFFFPSKIPCTSPAPGKVVNLTVEAFNYSAVNLIWYLPRQPNGKITSFKISVKHARSGIVVKDVSIRVEDILTGKLPECNVSLMERFLCLRILGKLHRETPCIWILCIFTKVIY